MGEGGYLRSQKNIGDELLKFAGRRAILCLFDMLCYWFIIASYLFLNNIVSGKPSVDDTSLLLIDGAILFGFVFAFRIALGVYNAVWRYTSTESYFRLVLSDMLGGIFALSISRTADINPGFWFFVIIASLNALLALFARYSYRLIYKRRFSVKAESDTRKNVAIIGAGQLGVNLVNDLKASHNATYDPVCFIDIDKNKSARRIAGIPVLLPEKFEKDINRYSVSDVIIAISDADSDKLSAIRDNYRKLGCKVMIYSSAIDGVAKDGKNRVIRDFEIEDLLFRKKIDVIDDKSKAYYKDKVILVTGGGGSIGSELCRQIAKCSPKKIIIFDIYENNAYDIQQELIRKYSDSLDLSVEIGSVRDERRLANIFAKYRPQIVFHAAAHKHVPLMEESSCEAIKNNVFGTYNTANAAELYGVERFVLISTDKAVNPTNIMGASKRLCEMVIQCRTDGNTEFMAVRFGNVLGSNGSVIPLFEKQIANGGPITITSKKIIRYFMTIPEASQLVMTAGAMAHDGEIFILDMGKPIRIYDLAVNMIKLSGLVPEKDIKIEEIGLRPGEKLYEEILVKGENLDKTSNDLIYVERDKPYTREELEIIINELREAVYDYECKNDFLAVKNTVKKHVSTYKEPHEINKDADLSKEMNNVHTS